MLIVLIMSGLLTLAMLYRLGEMATYFGPAKHRRLPRMLPVFIILGLWELSIGVSIGVVGHQWQTGAPLIMFAVMLLIGCAIAPRVNAKITALGRPDAGVARGYERERLHH